MSELTPAPIGAPLNVVKFPNLAARRMHARKPRRSKNGTPEERAARTAAEAAERGKVIPLSNPQRSAKTDAMPEAVLPAQIMTTAEAANAHQLIMRVGIERAGTVVDAMSETGRNERLRSDRRAAWRSGEAKLEYWRAYRKLHSAIHCANDRAVLDDLHCPAALRCKHGNFTEPWILDNNLLIRVHAAEVDLLLTPAPDVASLNWKQQRMKHQWYQPPDADTEYLRRHFGRKRSPFRDIEQAIADDEAWLKAHPARQCKANKQRGKQ